MGVSREHGTPGTPGTPAERNAMTSTTPTTPTTTSRRTRRVGRLPRVALATAAGATAGILALGAVAAAPAGASSQGTTVKAVETDFHIALSKKTFAPGKYTFEAINKGQTTHALEITGSGLKNAKTKDITPGQTAKLTVTFKKGPYDIFCPIPGHKALGMNVNIVVVTAGATSSSNSSKGSTTTSSKASSSSGGYGY
jgi:uncharacterized cupredoxin-like copper-binding protein